MRRRDFLGAAAIISTGALTKTRGADVHGEACDAACHPTYASPADAMRSEPERRLRNRHL